MDIITHGLAGAIAANSAGRAGELRGAALIGFAAAMLPDADVLIRSDTDPLLVLEYHRHFSHSLLFVPVGALIAALLLWPLLRRRLPLTRIYLYALLGFATAGLLDACTSYGTRLLWPFDAAPIAWSIIAIVDPVFTLILATALFVAWRVRGRRWARIGAALAIGYLAVGVVQHQRAFAVAQQLAFERELAPQRLLVKPTMGNLVLWRAMAVVDRSVHIDAVRVGLLGGVRVYPGTVAPVLEPDAWADLPPGSNAYRQLQRFHGYADRLLVEHPADPGFIGDLRYSMMPTDSAPLWGIVLDPSRPDAPVEFQARRRLSPAMRARFTHMLLGR